jgi:hypothetical protein
VNPMPQEMELLILYKVKMNKVIAVTGIWSLQVSEMLRIPHCLENLLSDGGKVVSLTQRPHFTSQKYYFFRKLKKFTSSGPEPATFRIVA